MLQYTTESGISVSVIWGYNNTLPIAKIINAKYDEMMANSSLASFITAAQTESNSATGTEAVLVQKLNNLRNNGFLPSGSMVTCYTYKSLIGMTNVIYPDGNKVSFSYDTFGRLINTKDLNNFIISESQYQYKLPN